MKKRLVVCCDGTWQNLSSPYPTNVVKIAQAVRPIANDGLPQLVFYQEGIGNGDAMNHMGGGAFGWGIDRNIQDAYRFLCLNYVEGDEIYLFGFSRGAYTVRSLAGLIYCSGLLLRQHIRLIPEAYQLYRDRTIKPSNPEAINFRQIHGEKAPVTLLGCWDTVGELGIPSQTSLLPIDKLFNERYRFHDTTLNRCIQHALHAVAIDEQRKVFDVTPMRRSLDNSNQTVRQVWFPGVHGCIGGGVQQARGLSDGALKWMMDQIQSLQLGLDLDPTTVVDGIQPDYTTAFASKPTGVFGLTGQILRKVVGTCEGELPEFHDSVRQRWQTCAPPYRPKNLEAFAKTFNESINTLNQLV